MYVCVRGINFASYYDFDIWLWNCSHSFVFHFIIEKICLKVSNNYKSSAEKVDIYIKIFLGLHFYLDINYCKYRNLTYLLDLSGQRNIISTY